MFDRVQFIRSTHGSGFAKRAQKGERLPQASVLGEGQSVRYAGGGRAHDRGRGRHRGQGFILRPYRVHHDHFWWVLPDLPLGRDRKCDHGGDTRAARVLQRFPALFGALQEAALLLLRLVAAAATATTTPRTSLALVSVNHLR